MVKVAAVVLAAGMSSRFERGPTKLMVDLDGKPLIRHVVDAAAASMASPIVVVTGHAREEIRAALRGADVIFVHNDDYETGIASSLRSGLGAAPPDIDGAVICLADMPKVASSSIDLLILTFARSRRTHAIVPTHAGRRGNPVLLSRRLFARAGALTGDVGARRLLNEPDVQVIETPVDDAGVAADVDTREALDELSRMSRASGTSPSRS